MKIPENVEIEIKKQDITVSGIEKELVGQIRESRKVSNSKIK